MTIIADVSGSQARSALFDQLKISTGITVDSSIGPFGTSPTKATMPISSSGAVSPSARARPMIAPVRMPGMAVGSTTFQITWLRVHPMPDTLAFQVDLWPARGELPTSMDEVAQRQKDIQYSSRTRLVTDNYRKILQLRRGLQTLLERLPAGQRNSPDLADLRAQACTPLVNVVNLIYQAKHYERESKDYEFSTEAMREHWQFGLADIRRTLAQPRVLDKPSVDQSFITHDVHRSAPDSR